MESVTIAFDLMKVELQTTVEDLNAEGAKLFSSSRYSDARALTQKGEQLADFCRRVEALAAEWRQNFSEAEDLPNEKETETARRILSSTKSPKTRLLVTFPDGHKIAEKTAAMTLAQVVKQIGFEKVEKLNIKVNRMNLVSRQPSAAYGSTSLEGFHIQTHSSTDQKRRHLEYIADQTGIDLEITII